MRFYKITFGIFFLVVSSISSGYEGEPRATSCSIFPDIWEYGGFFSCQKQNPQKAPIVSITSHPIDPIGQAEATFEFTADMEGASFECTLHPAEWESCTSPKTYIGLSEGTHLFLVRGYIDPGHKGKSAYFSWEVELTAPDTEITFAPPDPSESPDAVFEFECDEAECTFECELDGGGYFPCSSPEEYEGLEDGEHEFSVRAWDTAGNVDASPAEYIWTVNTIPHDSWQVPPGLGGALPDRRVGHTAIWTGQRTASA